MKIEGLPNQSKMDRITTTNLDAKNHEKIPVEAGTVQNFDKMNMNGGSNVRIVSKE